MRRHGRAGWSAACRMCNVSHLRCSTSLVDWVQYLRAGLIFGAPLALESACRLTRAIPDVLGCCSKQGRFDKDEAQGGRNMSASTNGIGPHGHSSAVSLALLLLRIAAGLVFLYHGCAILFGAFGGPGPQ